MWFRRWVAYEYAKTQRRAREAVETNGMGKVTQEAREIYNALILGLRDGSD